MRPLSRLADQLLLGTDRQVPALAEMPPALAGLLARGGDSNSERETGLLRAAGALYLYGIAGFKTPKAMPPPVAAEPEDLGTAGAEMLPVLRAIFHGGPAAQQREALAMLAQASLLLPPQLLPRALALAASSPVLKSVLSPVLGKRGRWLAQQNPTWSYVASIGDGLPEPALWDHGTATERQAYLASLRRHQPDRARRSEEHTSELQSH